MIADISWVEPILQFFRSVANSSIFMIWQIVHNIIGHTGFEIHPRWLIDSPLGKILNTTTNHAMHHEKLRGNYGLYFNVWDRLMKTNHADYEARFREVTSRPKES